MSTPHITTTPAPVAPEAGAGDAARWFNDEVHAHDRQLKAYLRGAYPSVRDVDDVVQESYLRIWRTHAVRPVRSAKAFLFQVARNIALDVLRRRRTSAIDPGRDFAEIDVIEEKPHVAETMAERERMKILVDAIASLPTRYQELLILRKLENIPQKEVAARLGLSERTVENLLARGIKRCEELLRKQGVRGLFDS